MRVLKKIFITLVTTTTVVTSAAFLYDWHFVRLQSQKVQQKYDHLLQKTQKILATQDATIGQLRYLEGRTHRLMAWAFRKRKLNFKELLKPQTDTTHNTMYEPHTQDSPSVQLDAAQQSLTSVLSRLEKINKLLATKGRAAEEVPILSPTQGHVTSEFGYRKSPMTGKRKLHKGIDIRARIGTEVVATAEGTVVFTGKRGGYGNMIVIEHPHELRTRYAHLSKILVKRGQRVKARSKIGLVGHSGQSTGDHLHYETVYKGQFIDPRMFLVAENALKPQPTYAATLKEKNISFVPLSTQYSQRDISKLITRIKAIIALSLCCFIFVMIVLMFIKQIQWTLKKIMIKIIPDGDENNQVKHNPVEYWVKNKKSPS
ncbi:MAG: M23 family metallopeptidase [Oligoflexales bacterium]